MTRDQLPKIEKPELKKKIEANIREGKRYFDGLDYDIASIGIIDTLDEIAGENKLLSYKDWRKEVPKSLPQVPEDFEGELEEEDDTEDFIKYLSENLK